MSRFVSRRRILTKAGVLLTAVLSGCLSIFDTETVQQPSGDILFQNHHTQYHTLSVQATNQHAQPREGWNTETRKYHAGLKGGLEIREERFFVAGVADVIISVDETVVEETQVEIRGEDEDHHEESLIVTIYEDGITEVTVQVTHTSPN